MTIKILIADNRPLVLAGVAQLIGTEPDLEVVCEAADGLQAVSRAAVQRPDW